MQLVEEQANATDSTLGDSGHMGRWETPACRHILSLARSEETFLHKWTGCELDSSSANRSGQIWGAELYCKNGPRGKWVSSSLLGNKYTANYK